MHTTVQFYGAQTHATLQFYSAQMHTTVQFYGAQMHTTVQFYSAQTHTTVQLYSAQTHTTVQFYSAHRLNLNVPADIATTKFPINCTADQNSCGWVGRVLSGADCTLWVGTKGTHFLRSAVGIWRRIPAEIAPFVRSTRELAIGKLIFRLPGYKGGRDAVG
jgi:hypothetical protein